MILLDGKQYSKKLKEALKIKATQLIETNKVTPGLAIVLVGNNPASQIYVRNKIKDAAFCNIYAELFLEDENISQEKLVKLVQKLNKDERFHGIIVQLPLPKGLDEQAIIDTIDEAKDVDGFGTINKGKLFCGMKAMESATPKGIIKLLDEYKINLTGMNACVVGRSNIVGKPMALMLLNKNATVTICHSKTKDLGTITKRADLLIVAVGKDRFIKADMVKEGAVVVDVGTNRIDGKLYGDVDFAEVAPKTSYITPVPGGVGPLTICTLLENTLIAYENILKTKKGE